MSKDRLLSLSQAARMVGVRRRDLQREIQAGHLATFEGHVRMSALLGLYPETQPDRSGMVEKVQRIRDAAVLKGLDGTKKDPDRLAAELQRLRVKLAETEDQLESHKRLAAEMTDRLVDFQERCDRQQALMMGTLVGWYMHQVKLREN